MSIAETTTNPTGATPRPSGPGPAAGLPRLFERLPAGLDLRDAVQLESLLDTADALLARSPSLDALSDLEWMLAADPRAWPLSARVAVKLARSKALLRRRRKPLHLSVALPVYAEHERIQRPGDHPLGEGFMDRKLRQLEWLFGGHASHRFELLVVDDGCPHASGHIARAILRARHPDAPARVSFLADAIAAGLPIVEPMRSTDESRKGGAVHYGLWQATRVHHPGHVLLYTDADLSTHLGQSGLLIDALERPGVLIAAGSRRDRLSVSVKRGARSARGRLFIYLWKQLLPMLAYVDDTQCGFKAFAAPVGRRLIEPPGKLLLERGLAFDVELLLRCELARRHSIATVPIAWIDSEAASNVRGSDPHLDMLKRIVVVARHHLGPQPRGEPFARAIEALDAAGFRRAVEVLGPRLEAVAPALDGTAAHVPAAAFTAVAA